MVWHWASLHLTMASPRPPANGELPKQLGTNSESPVKLTLSSERPVATGTHAAMLGRALGRHPETSLSAGLRAHTAQLPVSCTLGRLL